MPAVVVAAAAAWTSTAIATSAAVIGVLGTAGAAVAGALGAMAVSRVVGSALGMGSSSGAAAAASGTLINSTGTVDVIPVVYGTRRLGGTRVFLDSTGTKHEYLHCVVSHCEGEINAITAVYFDNVLATDARFAGKYTLQHAMGTDAQTANAALSSALPTKWTSAHKLSGVAYTYARLTYDQDAWHGLPTITVDVQGRKVYDPRNGTTAWSANPALCLRDYLTNARFGRGIASADLDDASFIAAANYCDATISTPAGNQPRYTCNAVLDTSRNALDNVQLLLTCMRGMLVFTGGKYRLVLDRDAVAGFTFNESNITGGWQISLADKRRTTNRVRASWINPARDWQPDLAVADSTSYRSTDNGLLLEAEIALPCTTNAYEAQTLAQRQLKQSRFGTVVSFRATIAGLYCECGDVVAITHSTPGWTAKPFRITRLALLNSDEVEVTATEYDASVYAGDVLNAPRVSLTTGLPDPFTLGQPTGLTATTISTIAADGTAQTQLRVTWTAPADAFVQQYELQWRVGAGLIDLGLIADAAGDTQDSGSIATAAGTLLDYGSVSDSALTGDTTYSSVLVAVESWAIPNVVPSANYSIQVRAINGLGVHSAWTQISTIPGEDTTPPGLPSNVAAVGGFRQITLNWLNPTDADFDYVEILRNTTNNQVGATLLGAVRGTSYVDTGLGVNVQRYYWLRAADRTGNRSAYTSSVNATTQFVDAVDFSTAVNNMFTQAGAYGIEPVAALPGAGDFDGQIVFLKSDLTLYRWDAGTSSWKNSIYSKSSVDPGSITASSFAAGIEPVAVVSSLPNPSGYTGPKVVILTTDGKLYRYVSGAWTAAVPTADLTGTLTSSNFPNGLRPVEIVAGLPATDLYAGRTVFLTTDNKLYRYTGTAWTATVSAADISGQIADGQVAALSAAKLTGTLSDAQIAAVSAAKLTGTLTSAQIADNAITASKIVSAAIDASKIAASAIDSTKLAVGAVTTAKIAAGAVTAAEIGAAAVTAGKIAAAAVGSTEIAAGSVVAGKIAAGAVTAGTIDAGAVTAAEIAAGAITTGKLAAGAVTASELAANAVTATKIDAGAVTAGKIAASAIDSTHISAGSVTAAAISAGAVTTAKLAAGAVTASELAAGAVTAGKIAAGAITSAEIAAETITAAQIATGAITATELAAGSVTTAKIVAGAVTAATIGAGEITAGKLAAGSVTAGNIAANAVTAGTIAAGAVTATEIAAGAITTAKLAANAVTANELAANSIVAGKIAAGAVSASAIEAGAISTDKIQANAITAGLIAASGVITSAAQITDGIITNAKIANLAVDTIKIAGNAVTSNTVHTGVDTFLDRNILTTIYSQAVPADYVSGSWVATIYFSADCTGDNDVTGTAYLKLDGVTQATFPYGISVSGGTAYYTMPVTFAYCGAGSGTLTVQVTSATTQGDSTGDSYARNIRVIWMGGKR